MFTEEPLDIRIKSRWLLNCCCRTLVNPVFDVWLLLRHLANHSKIKAAGAFLKKINDKRKLILV